MAELTINTAPAIPTFEQRTSRALPGSQDVTTHALAPEQQAVTDEENKLLEEQKRIEEQHRLATQAENDVKSETAQQMADAAAGLQADREKAIADTAGEIDLWRDRLQSANRSYMAAPMPSLFKSGDTGRNVLKGIGLLLGAVGDARMTTATMLAGHAPSGRSAVDQMIENDFAEQRAAIEKLKDNAVIAASGLRTAEDGRKLLLANVDVKQAAVYDRINKLLAARTAAITDRGAPGAPGTAAAQIQADANNAEWTDKALKKRADAVDGLTQSITKKFGGTTETTVREAPAQAGGGGTEADTKAANFNLLKEHSEWLADHITDLTPAEADAVWAARAQQAALTGNKTLAAGVATLGGDVEAGMSPRAKEYLDRVARASDAMVRLKSGAGANATEDDKLGSMFMVRPSDKGVDLKMRAKNMRKDVDIMGGFLDRAPRNTVARPEGPAAPTAPPPAVTPAAETNRDRAIRVLRANPSMPGAQALIEQYKIAPAELKGAP